MNHSPRTARTLILLMAMAWSGATYAAGQHAGGHGHDDDTAIGKPGLAAQVSKTITIEMSDDMRYHPAKIQVRQGETVRLIVKNGGKVKHELSLGTEKELLEHLEVMKKYPDMEHDEPGKLSLAPGKQGEIIWQFTKPGTVHFACLMPGHFEAGMRGGVSVARK